MFGLQLAPNLLHSIINHPTVKPFTRNRFSMLSKSMPPHVHRSYISLAMGNMMGRETYAMEPSSIIPRTWALFSPLTYAICNSKFKPLRVLVSTLHCFWYIYQGATL